MSKTIAVFFPMIALAVSLPCVAQTTDPKATDMNGNGPPAFVMTKGQDAPLSKEDKKKALLERPIHGVITDADGKPVVGAVVQLKNTRTLQVRSFITHEKGEYYFTGLSKDVDYEVKAQFSGKASSLKILSSFDTKPEPVINLQIK